MMVNFQHKKHGWTLIELMIAMLIATIVMLFAHNGYQQYLMRTRRMDAQLALMHLANEMENYFRLNHSYLGVTIGTGKKSDVLNDCTSSLKFYCLSITSLQLDSYTLKAQAISSQRADLECQAYTLTSFGHQGTYPLGNEGKCWL